MAIARYKYASQTVEETAGHVLSSSEMWWVEKSLEPGIGIVFQVRCAYGGSGDQGLTVLIRQGIDASRPAESTEAAVMAFEMPNPGVDTTVTIPVLLPEVGPKVVLQLYNSTDEDAYVTVWSRMIEGVEIV